MKHTILCIDDEIDNLDALERLLRKKYQVLRASSGKAALKILDQNPEISVIVSDQRMPEMTGVELMEKSLVSHPDTVRILLTGYTDIESIIAAVNQGNIFRYITKPWETTDLLNCIHQATEKFDLSQILKLKNRELEIAFENLKKLELAKSKFMILINHELKTPITILLNYLELLKEQTSNQEYLLYIEKCLKSSYRLKEIIDDVLLVMKQKTNQLELDKQNILIEKSILKTIGKFEKEIEKKLLKISISSPFEIQVLFNEKYFEKILNELIKNAVYWSFDNTTINIEVEKVNKSNIQIVIINEGSPINHELLDRISEPFKLPESIMNHSKGMGLGLSVVEALLTASQSKLNIQNTDKGVRVSFLLNSN